MVGKLFEKPPKLPLADCHAFELFSLLHEVALIKIWESIAFRHFWQSCPNCSEVPNHLGPFDLVVGVPEMIQDYFLDSRFF